MPFQILFILLNLIFLRWLVMRLSLSMPAKESASLSVSSMLVVWFEILDTDSVQYCY